MDMTFQQEYGPEYLHKYGTADHWPPFIQIRVARRARDGWYNPFTHRYYSGRGYWPWPNTARFCNLL